MKRAERLHALTESLRRSGRRGRTAEALAREFDVSVRTIKRDLAALETSGTPIWSRPGPCGGFGIVDGGSLPPIALSSAQALGLLAAVRAAPNAPYSDLAAAGVRKILDVLDPGTREQVNLLSERIWVNSLPSGPRAVRSACEHAMTDQRVLRIDYTSRAGERTHRDIEPMLFASTGGTWYLIGWCRLRDAVRWFSLDRITRAVVTSAPCSAHSIDEVGKPPATATSLTPG